MGQILSARTPQQAFSALLECHKPESILLLGMAEMPAVSAFQQAYPKARVTTVQGVRLPDELLMQRFDLALLVDCLEHLPKILGQQLLGGIRNLHASRLAVLVDLQASGWQETDFYALAMQLSERFQRAEQSLSLFTYDLLDYKQLPSWLNDKFWANPENFGKYWW